MENTKVTKKVSAALKTIDPVEFVAAVFDPFAERLALAIKETANVEFDITTTAGMELAKKCRATFRDIRIEADKERKFRKEPLLLIGKMLEAKNTDIENEAKPHEDKFDAVIKAEEARKEEVKAAIMREIAAKEAAINAAIDAIKNKPIEAIHLTAEKTQVMLDELMNHAIQDEFFGDRLVEAELLIDQTVQTLTQMIDGKKAQEQIAAQAMAAQAETTRVASIKDRINNIKTVLMDAMDVNHSSGFTQLINALNAVEINQENFAEFVAEAQAAKEATLKGLYRQFDAMVFAETQAAAAAEQKTTVIIGVDWAKNADVNDSVLGVLEDQFQEVFEVSDVSTMRRTISARDIVNAVAATFLISDLEAHKVIIEADFMNMTFEKAAA